VSAFHVVALHALFLLLALPVRAAHAQTWEFEARLDGTLIGTHRFVVSGPPSAREVESTARFEVKVLGISVYRYRLDAHERWQGDCLSELHSRTDADGELVQVDLDRDGALQGSARCMMSFAYWHPRLPEQGRLLNPQTGLVEDTRFERLSDATLRVHGRDVSAARWRLFASTSTTKQELILWLGRTDGAWIGLDARVKSRLLTYRLP